MQKLVKFFPYAKAIVAAAFPAVQLALAADNNVTPNEWKDIGVKALAALFVLLVPAPGYRAPSEKAQR